jgi:amino acid permease
LNQKKTKKEEKMFDAIKDFFDFRNDENAAMSIGIVGAMFFASNLLVLLSATVLNYEAKISMVLVYASLLFMFIGLLLMVVCIILTDHHEFKEYPKLYLILLPFALCWRKYIMKNKKAEI